MHCLLAERKLLQNVRTDPDELININSYDLYRIYKQQGNLNKAIFYLEKATFFSVSSEIKMLRLGECAELYHKT